jgi:NAD+-dependent protein deacetylase SIR2
MDLIEQDFRSSNGLFSMTKGTGVNNMSMKDLFDRNCLRSSKAHSMWLTCMAELREKAAEATISRTHGFLWVLHCKHKLQRIYTQNIDGLEDRIGIPSVEPPYHKVIPGGHVKLHGSLTTLRCISCSSMKFFSKSYMKDLSNGIAPDCPSCREFIYI